MDPADLDVLWGFTLPQLACPGDVASFVAGLKEHGTEIVIVDPSYLCLLAGLEGKEINAANMFQIGPLLYSVGQAILGAGATPILIHHSRKNLQDPFAPMELEDLAYAGWAEYARQWLLLNRRERYEPGTGTHKLWLSAGGSAGQGGEWALNVNEGTGNAVEGGRVWEPTVEGARESRVNAADEKKAKQQRDDETRVLDAFKKLLERAGQGTFRKLTGKADPDAAVPYMAVLERSGVSNARAKAAINRLEDGDVIEVMTMPKAEGVSGKAPKGIKGKAK